MRAKEEEFYIEPPYNYRPSIVEYLTDMNVSEEAFFADLLHLDRKKNINIEKYEKDRLVIRLISNKDLTDSEVYLWDFLKRFEKNSVVELRREYINKNVIEYYSFLVRKNFIQKFYLHSSGIHSFVPQFIISFYKGIHVRSERNLLPLKLSFVALSFFVTFFSSILSLFLVLSALSKVWNSPGEIRSLMKNFVWRYIKITILTFFLFVFFFFAAISALVFIVQFLYIGALIFLLIFPISVLWLFGFLYYRYGLFLMDFITWLFEGRDFAAQRTVAEVQGFHMQLFRA
jgi:hypothetical protein